jgi:hypothetical protein
VVAGGGGGGLYGGGGAGGFLTGSGHPVDASTPYSIEVGGGGPASNTGPARGANGSNSIFDTITSAGGGGGGSISAVKPGASGGSGGGGGSDGAPSGGAGNTPTLLHLKEIMVETVSLVTPLILEVVEAAPMRMDIMALAPREVLVVMVRPQALVAHPYPMPEVAGVLVTVSQVQEQVA